MPNKAQQAAGEFTDWLIEQPEIYDVNTYSSGTTVDFCIGERDLWPSYTGDGINAVCSSSVRFGGLTPHSNGEAQRHNPQTGGGIHLPPTYGQHWEEIEDSFDLPEGICVVNGTFALGSLMPPPNGVATPHIIITEEVDVEQVIEAISQALDVYAEVYDNGDEVIKEKP